LPPGQTFPPSPNKLGLQVTKGDDGRRLLDIHKERQLLGVAFPDQPRPLSGSTGKMPPTLPRPLTTLVVPQVFQVRGSGWQ